MAKKAKKTTAKKRTTKVSTTAKVVTKSAKKVSVKNVINNRKKIKDIDRIFSAKTVSMLFVELLGAMILAIIFSATQGQNHIYLLFVMTALVVLLANFSVTLFNPIVSFGAWIANKISAKKMILTIIAQILGVMLAVVLMRAFLGAIEVPEGAMAQKPELFKLPNLAEGKEWFILFGELIASFVFGLLFAQSWKEKDQTKKALMVSGALFVSLVVGSILSGKLGALTMINPTYVLLTLNEEIKNIWTWIVPIYVIIPLLGGALGFLIDKVLIKDDIKTTIK